MPYPMMQTTKLTQLTYREEMYCGTPCEMTRKVLAKVTFLASQTCPLGTQMAETAVKCGIWWRKCHGCIAYSGDITNSQKINIMLITCTSDLYIRSGTQSTIQS